MGGPYLQGRAPLTGRLLQSPTRPCLPCRCPSCSAQRRCWGNACQNEMTGCLHVLAFPIVMYRCESWTIRKAECQRIDAFELWCWRRLLRVPWTARRSNQSILKEISPGCSLGGLMLKLKLQYFGHLMRRTDSLEKTLTGKDSRREEKGATEDKIVGWHH